MPLLVDPEISRTKFVRELAAWKANAAHQERGWLLLDADEQDLRVEIAFTTRVSLSTGNAPLPLVACAIRLGYENYDIWAPTLTFIDWISRLPVKPHVRAIMQTSDGPRDVLVDEHPTTGLPFLCLPGIREYHIHPQHSGDSWLLHRQAGEGTISNVCERVWRLMALSVVGLHATMIGLPGWPLRAQVNFTLAQAINGN